MVLAHVLTGSAASFRNARRMAGVVVLALAAGCAGLAPQSSALLDAPPAGLPPRVELASVPFFPQEDYQCGPAALATALVAGGVKVTPEALVPQVYLPARQGSLQVEMLAAARRNGLVSYQLAPRFEDLLREVASGNPVIVLQNLGLADGWHYAVVVGYDVVKGELVLRSGTVERQILSFPAHEVLWKRSGYWAMVTVPPGKLPATADGPRLLASLVAFERVRPAEAGAAYAAFLERFPASIGAAVGLANRHHAAGDYRAAEAVLREAAGRAPDNVVVLNNLAQTLSDQGRHEEALPIIDRAVAAGGPHAAAVAETRNAILQKIRK